MDVSGSSRKIGGILLAALLASALAVRAALPTAGPTAAMPKQADFCAGLARVMAAATAGIETLRGKAGENGEWAATEALPGMHDCVIQTNQPNYDAPLRTYRCGFSERDDATAASADLESLRRLISQCLGESWQGGEIEHPGSHSLFFNKKGEPSLQLTQNGYKYGKHEVGLLVYPPTVSITLQAPAGKATNLDAPVDIKAKDETARTIFRAAAEVLGVPSVVDAEAHGRATVERKDASLREVLDAVCVQAGCTWSLKPGEHGPQVWLEPKKP